MKVNPNPACRGCLYNGGNICTSKTKKKELKYQKYPEGNNIIFKLIECGEQKVVDTATS